MKVRIAFRLIVFCIILLTCLRSEAQTIQTVKKFEIYHQDCLDTGVNMLGCSKKYYFQMDSLLNVAYNKLRLELTASDKAVLKQEQLQWLKKRDVYFDKKNKEFQKKLQSGEWGADMQMITYDEQADFVKERVIILLKRLHEKN